MQSNASSPFLQSTASSPYLQSHPAFQPVGDPDPIYYCVQDPVPTTVYSSSGSASSEHTASTGSTTDYCSPNTPRRLGGRAGQAGLTSQASLTLAHSNNGHPGKLRPHNTLVGGGAGKKRTLVQYSQYPDVLPSDNKNQNYYV